MRLRKYVIFRLLVLPQIESVQCTIYHHQFTISCLIHSFSRWIPHTVRKIPRHCFLKFNFFNFACYFPLRIAIPLIVYIGMCIHSLQLTCSMFFQTMQLLQTSPEKSENSPNLSRTDIFTHYRYWAPTPEITNSPPPAELSPGVWNSG